MIRAVAIRILRQVLLVIVGAESGITCGNSVLLLRERAAGRIPVDAIGGRPADRSIVMISYFGSILVG
jgi:hypothetical protein